MRGHALTWDALQIMLFLPHEPIRTWHSIALQALQIGSAFAQPALTDAPWFQEALDRGPGHGPWVWPWDGEGCHNYPTHRAVPAASLCSSPKGKVRGEVISLKLVKHKPSVTREGNNTSFFSGGNVEVFLNSIKSVYKLL